MNDIATAVGTAPLAHLPDYHDILREEQHLGAIVYHLMQDASALRDFLGEVKRKLGHDGAARDIIGIYVEYAALRDLWKSIDAGFDEAGELKDEAGNQPLAPWIRELLDTATEPGTKDSFSPRDRVKRQFILSMLRKVGAKTAHDLLAAKQTIEQFNHFAGGPANRSGNIQSPGNWSVRNILKRIQIEGERLEKVQQSRLRKELMLILKFKWSFNIKPDLVIGLDDKTVVCVTLNYEGNTSTHPSSSDRKALNEEMLGWESLIDQGHNKSSISQTALERFMMEEMMGFDTCHQAVISRSGHSQKTNDVRHLTWHRALESLTRNTGFELRKDMKAVIDRIMAETKP